MMTDPISTQGQLAFWMFACLFFTWVAIDTGRALKSLTVVRGYRHKPWLIRYTRFAAAFVATGVFAQILWHALHRPVAPTHETLC